VSEPGGYGGGGAADMTNTLSEWNRDDRKRFGPGLNRTDHIGTQSKLKLWRPSGLAQYRHYIETRVRTQVHVLLPGNPSACSPSPDQVIR
jgi:hypothetical protein